MFRFDVPYANSAEGMFPGHQIFLTERFFEENLTFQRLFLISDAHWDAGPAWELLPPQVRALLDFDTARQVLFNVCNQMTIWATPRKGDWSDAPPLTAAEAARRSSDRRDGDRRAELRPRSGRAARRVRRAAGALRHRAARAAARVRQAS